jgi:hypothetical protein
MSHFLDQQFSINGNLQEESPYFQKDSIQTPTNILLQPKAEMITYPPLLNQTCKNCIYNKLSMPLFIMTLLFFIFAIIILKN